MEPGPLIFGTVLAAILAAIAVIDFRRLVIPDWLNAALAAAGLSYQAFGDPGAVASHLGAGFALLLGMWLVRDVHFRMTGRIGLGLGDVKMAAAAATWLNPLALPLFIFASAGSALVYLGGIRLLGNTKIARVPFGPFLSAGLFASWLAEIGAGSGPFAG
jgi:leader peptidase (prepilin peptidase)/N-methyltransferase